MEKLFLKNENETREFGLKLAAGLKPGDVIALTGELGTGKTTLAGYIAEGLGVKEEITSPTFTLIREYKSGRLPFFHFDLYRLAGEREVIELGYEEYFYGNGVCLVEWADNAKGLLPKGCITIQMYYGKNEFEREYEIYSDI